MSLLDITEETEGGREGDEGEVSGRKEKRQRQRRVLWRNGRGQGGRRECATLAWGREEGGGGRVEAVEEEKEEEQRRQVERKEKNRRWREQREERRREEKAEMEQKGMSRGRIGGSRPPSILNEEEIKRNEHCCLCQ